MQIADCRSVDERLVCGYQNQVMSYAQPSRCTATRVIHIHSLVAHAFLAVPPRSVDAAEGWQGIVDVACGWRLLLSIDRVGTYSFFLCKWRA